MDASLVFDKENSIHLNEATTGSKDNLKGKAPFSLTPRTTTDRPSKSLQKSILGTKDTNAGRDWGKTGNPLRTKPFLNSTQQSPLKLNFATLQPNDLKKPLKTESKLKAICVNDSSLESATITNTKDKSHPFLDKLRKSDISTAFKYLEIHPSKIPVKNPYMKSKLSSCHDCSHFEKKIDYFAPIELCPPPVPKEPISIDYRLDHLHKPQFYLSELQGKPIPDEDESDTSMTALDMYELPELPLDFGNFDFSSDFPDFYSSNSFSNSSPLLDTSFMLFNV